MKKVKMINKKAIITIAVAFTLILGVGISSAAISPDTLMCNYDPKTGDYRDPATGEWSAYGLWDDAIACAKEGLLPPVVANRLGWLGSKKDQITGAEAAITNARVAAEKRAEIEAEAGI